jgi:hypothetical protein
VATKNKVKKSDVERTAKEILEIVSSSKKKKDTSVKNKEKSFSRSEVKDFWKENFSSVITTKELTNMIQKLTGYTLGEDLTAGSKNLRRYLRSLPAYNDDSMTYYRWNRKEDSDVEEVLEILGHYNKKAKAV